MKHFKIKISREQGTIILTLLMLSSSLTTFMTVPKKIINAEILIKFSDYEAYKLPLSINENTTITQAISNQYYVKLENNTIKCIRSTCSNENNSWLIFNEYGQQLNPNTIIKNQMKAYIIYNKTSSTNNNDEQAIKELLGI